MVLLCKLNVLLFWAGHKRGLDLDLDAEETALPEKKNRRVRQAPTMAKLF